jgi:hypothetical protein
MSIREEGMEGREGRERGWRVGKGRGEKERGGRLEEME